MYLNSFIKEKDIMENEKDKIAEENKSTQPKPTDDVQLDIETVVPSAHKEEVNPAEPVDENDTKKQEQQKGTEDTDEKSAETAQTGSESKAPEKEGIPVTEGENSAKTVDQNDQQSGKEEADENEETTKDPSASNPDDKRDDIETVSP